MRDFERILYIAPDLEHPSGGVRAEYSHVRCLRSAGYEASAVHITPGHVHRWAEIDVPVLAFNAGLRITPRDVLVVPEGCLFPELAQLHRVRKIAFVQSCLYAFDGPGGAEAWRNVEFDGALCPSGLTAEFSRDILGISSTHVVPNYADPEIFRPGEKKLQVAYMPRKNPGEAEFIYKGLCLKRPDLAAVPWVPVQNMSIREAAGVLAESAVFLSLCFYEGFNLPPLEAMACRALSVGYHGYGGLEYAREDNGLWCGHADLLGCIRMLERGLDMVRMKTDEAEAMIENGARTAALFSREKSDEALLDAWGSIVGDCA